MGRLFSGSGAGCRKRGVATPACVHGVAKYLCDDGAVQRRNYLLPVRLAIKALCNSLRVIVVSCRGSRYHGCTESNRPSGNIAGASKAQPRALPAGFRQRAPSRASQAPA